MFYYCFNTPVKSISVIRQTEDQKFTDEFKNNTHRAVDIMVLRNKLKVGITPSGIWRESEKLLQYTLGRNYSPYLSECDVVLNTFAEHRILKHEDIKIINRNVRNIADKILMNKFLDYYEILHPRTFFYPFKKMPKYRSKKEKCLVKPRKGCHGSRISLTTFENIREKLSKKYYVQSFLPFEHEYRVVLFCDEIISIKEKVSKAEIKNQSNSKFRLLKVKNLGLELFSKWVCKCLDVEFSGLDIGEIAGNFYVIELNAAPGITMKAARKIAKIILGK
jgi:glutathione synthase/RimK-type ligase-like ATP-grasp enzyme